MEEDKKFQRQGKALILLYYDIRSAVKKNVKDEVVTFNLRLMLRLNLMRLDLAP